MLVSGRTSVEKWVNTCISTYKTKASADYRKQIKYRAEKYIIPLIGPLSLRSVRQIHCQQVLNQCAGMSYSHVRKLSQELKFYFEQARKNKLIPENPAEDLVVPEYTRGRRRAITDHERKHLYLVADKFPQFNLFLLMLECGCRPAEAVNCIGADIQIVDGFRMLHIRGTKTENSDRYVPMPDSLYERVRGAGRLDLLAPNQSGHKYTKQGFTRLSERLRRELNISMGCKVFRNQLIPPLPLAADFVPYDLRHTYCTDLQKQGIDVRTAQRLMGHADIQTTVNVYTHVGLDQIVTAAEQMGMKKQA